MRYESFEVIVRSLRCRHPDELNLIELMLSYHPPDVLSVASSFPSVARSVGCVLFGKVSLFEDFSCVESNERHFGCWDQEQVIFLCVVEILFEFRQLPCYRYGLPLNQVRKPNLRITMFQNVNIQHEIHEGSFQLCEFPIHNGESGTAELGCPFKIHKPYIGA